MEGEREEEKHQRERETLIGCFMHVHNPGTEPTTQAHACPERESNWRLYILWNNAQPTEPHQSGMQDNKFLKAGASVLISDKVISEERS